MDIEKVKKIYQLKQTKEELEAALKEINKEIAESQMETVQDMIDQGVTKIDSTIDGIEYSISFSFKPIFSFPGSEKGLNANRNKVLSLIQEKGYDPDGKITKFENWHIAETSKNKLIFELPEEERDRLMSDGLMTTWNKPSISFREKKK